MGLFNVVKKVFHHGVNPGNHVIYCFLTLSIGTVLIVHFTGAITPRKIPWLQSGCFPSSKIVRIHLFSERIAEPPN